MTGVKNPIRDPHLREGGLGGEGGGGDFLLVGSWVCAAGWGHIFTTGLTIMGLHIFRILGSEN